MDWETETKRGKGGSFFTLNSDVKFVNQIENESRKDRTKMTGKESEHSSKQSDMQGGRLDLERKWMARRHCTAKGVRIGRGIGMIWNRDSKYGVLEPQLARLVPTLLFCFHLWLKNDSLERPKTVSQTLWDLPHGKPCNSAFLPPRFFVL